MKGRVIPRRVSQGAVVCTEAHPVDASEQRVPETRWQGVRVGDDGLRAWVASMPSGLKMFRFSTIQCEALDGYEEVVGVMMRSGDVLRLEGRKPEEARLAPISAGKVPAVGNALKTLASKVQAW